MSPTFPPYPELVQQEYAPEELEAAKDAVQSIIDLYTYIAKQNKIRSFDEHVMRDMRLLSATGRPGDPSSTPPIPASAHPSALFELHVDHKYTNLNNVMHGGAATTVFDMATMLSLGPVHREGYWEFMGGVTRSLNTSFLKAVPKDTTVRIRAWVLQHGRTMAMMRAQMENVDGKIVYAACEQQKVNVPSLPEHIKLRALMREMKASGDDEKAKL